MATKKKSKQPTSEQPKTVVESGDILANNETPIIVEPDAPVVIEPEIKKQPEGKKNASKFNIGDIVYISKDTDSDLRGVGLFPQHKKYTYTVEDYNPLTGTYTIRRLNALLHLKGDHLLSPEEKAHDSLNKIQY